MKLVFMDGYIHGFMGKRILNKLIWLRGWLLMGLLLVVQPMAVSQPVADSCQHPEPPVITGSARAVCRAEAVVLTATGCIGTVVWSNGETGDQITVWPQQAITYTAICRARQGCISCFAAGWKIKVNTPAAPVVTSLSALICRNDALTLTATGCAGVVRWLTQNGDAPGKGLSWTDNPQQTTVYQATCEQNGCVSNASIAATAQVATPGIPVISADVHEICSGQSVRLAASGCLGTIRWSDGTNGLTHTVSPNHTTVYRALCQIGSCQSDSSKEMLVSVRPAMQSVIASQTLTNGCPFQTADLSRAIPENGLVSSSIHQYLFTMEPQPTAAAVQSPGAVLTGNYYIFGRSSDGCYTEPMVVNVTIQPCKNAVPACLSNPATLVAKLDTFDRTKGVVLLSGKLGGSAQEASWQSSGEGLFMDSGLNARYLLSEGDRLRGTTTFTLTTPDPDGAGPCTGISAQVMVTMADSREIVGLSKKVSEPVWVTEGANSLIEVTYKLTVSNMGQHTLTNVLVSDNLDAAFSSAGAIVSSVSVRADSGLVINPAYSGHGNDTTLVLAGQLPIGVHRTVWLTVHLNVGQARTLTFLNSAVADVLDVNGAHCRDYSAEGSDADPDRNGTPADNNEPTRVSLHALQAETGELVFIPEGFSPNNDGVNDRFVIQKVPAGVTVQLEVYNRWGQVVYQNNSYKNDWDGMANQNLTEHGADKGLPDGTYYYQVRLSDGREFMRFLTIVR